MKTTRQDKRIGDTMKAEELKSWRLRMGLTQKEMAKLMGYNYRSTISQMENGHMEINARVAALCKALENNREANFK